MRHISKNTAHLLCAVFAGMSLSACGGSSNEAVDLQNPGLSWPPVPTVTGHRGASALRPEHTLAAYQKAIDDGADIVEPDLVPTKDGVLVARHENEISGTTNVSTLPQFAGRKATKTIDGIPVTGWFTEDFTLAELKTLRAKERIPANRPANTAYDGQFEVPTLQEVIDLVKQQAKEKNRVIGIYPETKHPTYFKSIGLPLEKRLVDVLVANGYKGKNAAVFIQSFEVANLKELRGMTEMRLVQLIDNPLNAPVNGAPRNAPYDFVAAGSSRTYADLVKPAGLKEIAQYADAVSPYKEVIIPRDAKNELGPVTSFITDARAAGLKVHTWTLRPENPFLPVSMRLGDATSLTQRGDSTAEITAYLKAGIDGFFTDDPAVGRAAVTAFKK
ncbi:glycerophosphodiester phosphodiesterase [Undibacterium umbellatum]|jgi:glycerophosphoryl diester phosphodiesterase|uniref:glycerophosphodiester phosphodiesterase n=1 Tax=Undibacterium umbellatum TaxID=2762300 RepID=A0ABR6ZIA3_9BURK|nr:glycerophosphodiester phosphodiesterase [Undibacterium umbellatum]MBC3911450.1 glycerophosphodiester phosphodiesterase [Undibacterium umbellatum]